MKKIRIKHITTHLGGGVGRVLLGYLKLAKKDSLFIHSIASLDTINKKAKATLQSIPICFTDKVSSNHQKFINELSNYDILLFHWWNHPLMYEFMVKYTLPKCRVIMWSHISGFYNPSNFTEPLFQYADRFIFTTPISYNTNTIKKLSPKYKKKLSVIWSTAGLNHIKNVTKKSHDNFNIGYLGTIDYSKLHKDFLDLSSSINIRNCKFIVCGEDKERSLEKSAKQKNIVTKFNFVGKVDDIGKYLSIFDIFAYPLSPYHYGTCDQVSAEAMACGIVPVAFNNPMEKHMIEDGVTGILVKNKLEYKKAIEKLYKDKMFRNKLSTNAKVYANKKFSLTHMANEWEKEFINCLSIEKTAKKWQGKYRGLNSTALHYFLESTGIMQKLFEQVLYSKKNEGIEQLKNEMSKTGSWDSLTKGTLNHYLNFFHNEELNNLQTKLQLKKDSNELSKRSIF